MSNRFQIQAFFSEFPFLTRIGTETWWGEPEEWCASHGCTETGYHSHPTSFIEEDDVEEVRVERIGRDFLGYTPCYIGGTGSLVSISDDEKIFLLNGAGEVLTEVKQRVDITHNEAYRENVAEEGEAVGEALLRLDDPDSVMWAVKVRTGHRIRDHRSVGGYAVTVYKPPKGFTLRGWVDEGERRAAEAIQAIIAEIDVEA